MEKRTVKSVIDAVDTAALIARPLPSWRPVLANECDVYVFGENYIAKRFDQINYKYCEKNEAKEILVDNLYALLRYKYFPKVTEEIDKRISDIVNSFTANLKTTLKKVSFDKSSDAEVVHMLPDYCVAFRNGVYNFKDDKWLFKYDILKLDLISNTIYAYDPQYIIQWYLDYDFEPIGLNISKLPLKKFIEVMKEQTKEDRNYCFELLYNIAHNSKNEFDIDRFNHLCEILGYTCLQSFSQFFIMLIGSGQNGKNSLFDGCFTNRVVPRPASNDLDSIENDRFITGALENRYHNIFLETSPKTYTESKMIKNLTGSMYQTIEQKGVSKYSGVINCKYVFAGNDQDKIKFSDNTTGFKRRINMLEIWYRWDPAKKFLKDTDYYDTSFSDSLTELKDDVLNTTIYVYFAMYGIMSATDKFKKNFQFTENDWNFKYSDVDLDLKDRIESLGAKEFVSYTKISDKTFEDAKTFFFDLDKKRLYQSPSLRVLGYYNYPDMIKMFEDEEAFTSYFSENDVYVSIKAIQLMLRDLTPSTTFTQTFKKMFGITSTEMIGANKPYVKCTFNKGKLHIIV